MRQAVYLFCYVFVFETYKVKRYIPINISYWYHNEISFVARLRSCVPKKSNILYKRLSIVASTENCHNFRQIDYCF